MVEGKKLPECDLNTRLHAGPLFEGLFLLKGLCCEFRQPR
jgi:hypothetical protein